MMYQVAGMSETIITEFGITSAQYSALLFAPLVPSFLLGLVMGSYVDRHGAKRLIFVCCCITIAGSLLRIIAPNFIAYFVACVLIGFAIAALNANLPKILGIWFGVKLDMAVGWFYVSASAGMAAALATSSLFASPSAAYLCLTVAFSVVALAWMMIVPADAGAPSPDMHAQSSALGDIRMVIRNRYVWIIAINLGLGLAASSAYIGFLPQFLYSRAGAEVGGSMAALVTLGNIIGSLLGPLYIGRAIKYRLALVLTVCGGLLLMALCLVVYGNFLWLAFVLVGVFTAAAGPVVEALPCKLPGIGHRYAGAAGGLVAEVSLLMNFFIPIALAEVAGQDLMLLFAMMLVCFALIIPCCLALPARDKLLK